MTAPLYDAVHVLALDMTNASASENDQAGSVAYEALKELCQSQEGSELDHPLQWEALGDFSESHEEALQAYRKGFSCSSKLDLPEYSASIKFAMAEIYFEQKNLQKAQRLASEASNEAASTNDNELKLAISEFLNEVSHT
jgi:tetratricopeptide (TPR) repeat protein